MDERDCLLQNGSRQQARLDRIDVDRAESENNDARVSGKTLTQRSPTRQDRVKPWRWRVR